MAIKWVPDLGAPVAVVAADLLTEKFAPNYSKVVTGVLAVGGYVGSFFGFGGDFVKNIGIAALPAFAKNMYDWATAGSATSRAAHPASVTFRRTPVARPAAPISAAGPGFENVPSLY